MRRRALLTAAPISALTGCAAVDQIKNATNNTGVTTSGDINQIEWIDDGTRISIYFAEENTSEEVWLTHAVDTQIIYSRGAPRFDGPVSIPILDALACDNADYPSLEFELTAATGRPILGTQPETTGGAEFKLPDSYFERLSESKYNDYEGQQKEIRCDALRQGYDAAE